MSTDLPIVDDPDLAACKAIFDADPWAQAILKNRVAKTEIHLPTPVEQAHAHATAALNEALDAIVDALRSVGDDKRAGVLTAVSSLERAAVTLDITAGAMRDRARDLRFDPPEYAASERAGQFVTARRCGRIADACQLARAAIHASTVRKNNVDAGRLADAALEELAT